MKSTGSGMTIGENIVTDAIFWSGKSEDLMTDILTAIMTPTKRYKLRID